MTDPMQLLRASNPVHNCEAPDFGRLLARLEREPAAAGTPPRGRFVLPTRTKVPRLAPERRALAALVPVAVALAIAAVAVVSLHARAHRQTISAPGSIAYNPGQAHGRVVLGSMHRFTAAASSAGGVTWGAEWFRTTAGQICAQAGRQVGDRLGYVDVDGLSPHDGRFHAWAPNMAVEARCVDQPTHGGVALTVVEQVADSGYVLAANGACTAAEHVPCPTKDTTTLFFGVVGAGAVMVNYGTERHSVQSLPAGPGGVGAYLQAVPMTPHLCAADVGRCHARFPLPSSRGFVIYAGSSSRICFLHGPGTDGVLAGACPYGLTLGFSPNRLTAAEVRTRVHVSIGRKGNSVRVRARFRTRVASSRIAGYSLALWTPVTGCPHGRASGSTSVAIGGQSFRAGETLTERGSASLCTGTYHGSVLVQPLVGHQLTVARFSFMEHRGH